MVIMMIVFQVMIVMGGYEYPEGADDVVATDSIEKYDPGKGYWSMTNWKMPGARNEPCATAISKTEVKNCYLTENQKTLD